MYNSVCLCIIQYAQAYHFVSGIIEINYTPSPNKYCIYPQLSEISGCTKLKNANSSPGLQEVFTVEFKIHVMMY